MPLVINGRTYYRTAEVCQIADVSRNTLFRWMKEGLLSEPELRDWRGWRLYTEAQVNEIKVRTSPVAGSD